MAIPCFFGRRKGHALSSARKNALSTVLPSLLIQREEQEKFMTWVAASQDPLWMEIGCGTGDNLLSLMAHDKHARYIAVEPFYNGVAALVKNILPEDRPRIRIYPDVVHTVLPMMPDESLHGIFLLFPDPWPKSRHHKRRLLQRDFLLCLTRVLKRGAELHIATDSIELMLFMLQELLASPQFCWQDGARLSVPPEEWPEWTPQALSRYAQKALKSGRRNMYTLWTYRGGME